MFCVKCGVELADSEKVCPLCGTRVFHPDLPCGSGEALSLNPSLLTDFLRTQGAAPVWQCRVLRTHLYTKSGADFA